jgi:F-type H+-transporting ATPase subunit a
MLLAQAINPFEHVLDTDVWHGFESLGHHWDIPWPFTKYALLMILAALIILLIFIPLARRVRDGQPAQGAFWNAMESLLTFIRNNVAKPYIGHDADKFVPFLWTLFLFILVCNLLGMFPFMGSPTASLSVTAALAFITFCVIHGSAIREMGFTHYLESLVPHLDMPMGLKIGILVILFPIEVFGNIVRAAVLAIRLFANMFAGHLVLATLLLFIVMAFNAGAGPLLFWPITISTVIGVTLLSLLELFVAFLQAFIFVFLTALFIGMALHPEH